MIHYICREGQQDTVAPFLIEAGGALRNLVTVTSYEKIFSSGRLPAGHLIFTDLDLLSGDELEAAQTIADKLRAAVSGVRVFNEPARVLQRYALLTMLRNAGINPFRAVRLDDDIPALTFPVFIRREDGASGPETDLLHDENELAGAIAALPARGLPLRGRIAVEYCAESCAEGYFRKYGAFRIGDHILPQHILFSRHWIVKQESSVITPALVAEETHYIADNPHKDALLEIFERAHVDFGRIDYGFANGRIAVYEINTNPTFPHGDHRNGREHLRKAAALRLVEVLRSLDTPLPVTGRVACAVPARLRAGPGAVAPGRSFQLVGRSALLDRLIALYWKIVPEDVRRGMPKELKRSAMHVLDRLFAGRSF